MRINELLLEFEMPNALKDIPLVKGFGKEVTAGDVSKVVPDVDPETVVSTAKKGVDIARTPLLNVPGIGPYTVQDAIIDGLLVAADVYTLGAISPAIAARWGAKVGAKELESFAARKVATGQATKAGVKSLAKNIDVLPDFKKGSGDITPPTAASIDPLTKKRKYKVGDKVPVKIGGKEQLGVVKSVLPKGYEVSVADKSMNIPEPLSETATAGATSSGNIASTGNSPHIAAGGPEVLKRWSGSPGKMGKSIKAPEAEPQDADDNPVTNSKVGNNLIS